MIRNYFITALRNLIRNRIQAIIQIASLTIGITAFILIGLYVRSELNVDKFNEKYDRIYRLEYADRVGMQTAPGHMIKQQVPEVENVVRMVNWHGKDATVDWRYIPSGDSANERIITVEDNFFCDSSIFEIFTFNFIQGDPKSALRDPNSIVLSESLARTIFGDRDPVGESWNKFTVTGIFKDIKNSHIEINMLTSMVSFDSINGFKRGDPRYLNNWQPDLSYMTYLLLPKGADPADVERRINNFFIEEYKIDLESSGWEGFSLRPLEEIYFGPVLNHERNYCRHGNMKLLLVLMTVAAFILALGIINYVNLTTARASLRAREIGIRKVVGSSKSSLIKQFLVEAVLVTLVSSMLSLIMVWILLPGFNQLAMTDLTMAFIIKPEEWIMYLLSVITLGVISGIYPAIYMTGFLPVASLSGEQTRGTGSVVFRRVLLTFQYAISMVLIIGVLVLFKQLKYVKSVNLGFNKELVLNLNFGHWWWEHSIRDVFKNELLKNPNITGVTFTEDVMGGEQKLLSNSFTLDSVERAIASFGIDPDFFKVLEVDVLEGRSFSWDRPADYAFEEGQSNYWRQDMKIMINESAVDAFGLDQAVGTFGKLGGWFNMEIIGVVRDFNYKSLHEKIEPTMYFWGYWLGKANIRIAPGNIMATLDYIEEVFESVFSEPVFKYSFLDETYNKQYFRDEQTGKIISNFAVVAILLACFGLFGLSSFMATRRTKEIGIRKAFGAPVRSVFLLLCREFLKWMILSYVIACPAAWFIMNNWLQSFAYRTSIGPGIFVLAILFALIITFLTVSVQSLKTAITNPIDSLRDE